MLPRTKKFLTDHALSGVMSCRIVGLHSVREGFFHRQVTRVNTEEFFTGEVAFYLMVEVDVPGQGHMYHDIVTQDGESYWTVSGHDRFRHRRWTGCVIKTPRKPIISDRDHEIKRALEQFSAKPTEGMQRGPFVPPLCHYARG